MLKSASKQTMYENQILVYPFSQKWQLTVEITEPKDRFFFNKTLKVIKNQDKYIHIYMAQV